LDRLDAAGVEGVDLFEVYRRARQGRGGSEAPALYLARDTHGSAAGVVLAAKALAARLKARPGVRPGTVAYDVRPAPVRRIGDLVRLLEAPPIESLVGVEEIACRQVFRRDTGEVCKDAPDAEVLVLGDRLLRVTGRKNRGPPA
jgi:hypothetical protein